MFLASSRINKDWIKVGSPKMSCMIQAFAKILAIYRIKESKEQALHCITGTKVGCAHTY